MLHLFKISFKQLFSNSLKKQNQFIIYFSIISFSLCLSTLIIILSFSNGFNHEINKKITSIDAHYRINSYYNENLDSLSVNIILNQLSGNPSISTYSLYTEDYAMMKADGKSEGVIVYGIQKDKIKDIFNVSFDDATRRNNEAVEIIIGQGLSRMYNLDIGDSFLMFNLQDIHNSIFRASEVKVSNIFNSGFPEYDKSLCFISLSDAKTIFDYSDDYEGIIGKVNNPMEINSKFSEIFDNVDLSKYRIDTWIDRHSNLVKWLHAYNRPVIMIIAFIIILALFNMSLSLWIFLQNKLSEFSILLIIGFTRRMIFSIIIMQNIILSFISISFIIYKS